MVGFFSKASVSRSGSKRGQKQAVVFRRTYAVDNKDRAYAIFVKIGRAVFDSISPLSILHTDIRCKTIERIKETVGVSPQSAQELYYSVAPIVLICVVRHLIEFLHQERVERLEPCIQDGDRCIICDNKMIAMVQKSGDCYVATRELKEAMKVIAKHPQADSFRSGALSEINRATAEILDTPNSV